MTKTSIREIICIRCEAKLPVGDYYTGCPQCFSGGTPASVIPVYETDDEDMYMKLPYDSPTLLGEGNTPVVPYETLVKELGIKNLYVKNEFQNPTGSHKDRMSKAFILHAKAKGVKGIVLASSGNAGLSAATYAASQHLPCTVITSTTLSPLMGQQMKKTGAKVIIVETPEERWQLTQRMVDEEDYYPCTNYVRPPVGSNLWGIQGYKTIAYELFEHFGNELPTDIIIPVSRGDLLWGIYEGLKDLKDSKMIATLPRLIAVEPIPRLSKVLEGADYTNSFSGDYSYTPSIGGDTVTYQAYKAITATDGIAVSVTRKAVAETEKKLALSGRLLEPSSVAPFAALVELVASGVLDENAVPLVIATSNNFFIEASYE